MNLFTLQYSHTLKLQSVHYSSEYILAHQAITMASKHPGVPGKGQNKMLMIPHKL
jgi:hypothetical protein